MLIKAGRITFLSSEVSSWDLFEHYTGSVLTVYMKNGVTHKIRQGDTGSRSLWEIEREMIKCLEDVE